MVDAQYDTKSIKEVSNGHYAASVSHFEHSSIRTEDLKASGGTKSLESSYSSRKEVRNGHNIIFERQPTILKKMVRLSKMCLDGISRKLQSVL